MFIALATDAAWTLDASLTVLLDQGLPPTTTVSTVAGVVEMEAVNRAIGWLMNQGYDPGDAVENV